jgi:hypothetical protein
METVKQIRIPIIADGVLSPDFFYGEHEGIYFITNDDKHGRITFENLDAVKICRGEMLPYEFNYKLKERDVWIYEIENSKWQKNRFDYENEHYGRAYEFGGNVNEMLIDFKHYLFEFHDQFIEVISRGFWFEKHENSLFGKELIEGHPFLPLPLENMETMEAYLLKTQIRKNPKSEEELVYSAQFCSQKLFEFALELDGKARVGNTVFLSNRNGKIISTLRGYYGRQTVKFDGIASLEQVKPFIEKYTEEVYERRKELCSKKN